MRAFGVTWWGRAWVEALEGRARLDPNRLPRGRSYARTGRVGELSIAPGVVEARVQGTRPNPYRVRLRVREFSAPEWQAVHLALAVRAGHAAALLDGELDPGVVEALAQEGVELLPGPGELGPACSCPDWANPCKHAAAVCYLVAERMDRDPFTIFLLRGRDREELLAGVRARRVGQPAGRTGPREPAGARDLFVPAREALRPRRSRPPLPRPLPPPERPGRPAPLAVPYDEELADELVELAEDAARRAFELSWGLSRGGLDLSQEEDLARRAGALLGTPGFDRFARRVGARPRLLLGRALAWRAGGSSALRVLEGETREPTPEERDEALMALSRAAGPVAVRRGRMTSQRAGLQLRLGEDRLWYLLVRAGPGWEIHEPPQADPAALLQKSGQAPRAGDQKPVSGRAREA